MRKSKFSKRQLIEILKKIEDGMLVVETLRDKGVSKDTYHKWKRKYSGMETGGVNRHAKHLL